MKYEVDAVSQIDHSGDTYPPFTVWDRVNPVNPRRAARRTGPGPAT